jgi:hypothetical protein
VKPRMHTLVGSLAVVVAMAVGCASTSPRPTTSHSAGGGGTMKGSFAETPSPAGAGSDSASDGATGAGAVGAESAGMASGAPATAYGSAVGTAGSGVGGPSSLSVGLRAGGVDDNARFADYLTYLQQFASLGIAAHNFDVANRHIFTVVNPHGSPVLGADILIAGPNHQTATELRTYSDGRALWFPPTGTSGHYVATISNGRAHTTISLDLADHNYTVTLDDPATASPVPVDIEFVVDATGSMGDEIAQLKASLADIATRIDALSAKPDVRFALTIYRDRVDSFLTRTWNFTPDLTSFQQEIAGVGADGGGDYPEDVQQGLYDGLHKPNWRGPGTVKLMFLIGDAPPHLDYPNDPNYITTAQQAAADGVKIETLAASGLDDQGEYVWRQLGEITLGQFLFLTYGPNGGPGDLTTHHVNGYTPMNLDDLVVQVVSNELTATQATQPASQASTTASTPQPSTQQP